jgi:hypothetical protein
VHRLNSAEYNATVQDVLGTTLQPASASWRGGEIEGFDNIASQLGVDEAQYDRYRSAAQAMTTELLASKNLRARFGSCALSDPACAQSSIAAAGRRLFRRPLEASELQTYQRVYDAARALGDDEDASFALTLQALLSSAEFLYRIELDPAPESKQAHPLGAYELASRLSYFLWSSAPDEALLQSAADGSLTQPATLAATVDRMLNDGKSDRFITNFAGQWLGARKVPANPALVRVFGSELAHSASQEMLDYFGDFLHNGQSWFEFPTADFNYVDGGLAYQYGIPSQRTDLGPPFDRVVYHDDKRAGFFGLFGFLAVTSLENRTSPSRRGKGIAADFLCVDVPPPPPGIRIPELGADAGTDADAGTAPVLNVRLALEQHRANPSCASCHALFDPYGLALEQFDAAGRYRTTDDDGTVIDASATLPAADGHPAIPVQGLADLSQAIAADSRFGTCFAKKLFTYGLGRVVTPADAPHLAQAQQQWLAPGQTPSVRRMIQALIATDAFRSRRGGGP